MAKGEWPDQYFDQRTVLILLGVSYDTLNSWERDGSGPPRNPVSGKYPVSELGEWICKEFTLKPGAGGTYPHLPDVSRIPSAIINPPRLPGVDEDDAPVIFTKEQADTRLKVAQGDKLELDIAERTGALVRVDDVNQAWITILSRVKTRLTGLPSSLAQLAYGKKSIIEVQQVLESGVREALDQLSEDWRNVAEAENDG